MRPASLFRLLIPVLLLGVLLMDCSRPASAPLVEHVEGHPDEFARYFHGITVPEGASSSGYETGYRRRAFAALQVARKGGSTPLPWMERGPGNVGGRTRGLVIDIADPTGNTLLAGSVGGGIWRSEDAGLTWTPTTDDAPRLSVTSIAQALSEPAVMYAGTGEGFPNADASIGDGILKSTDGGRSWHFLPSTSGGRDFLFVNRVIVSPEDPDLVVAATRTGIWRSGDGGASWTRVLETSGFWGFYQVLEQPGNFSIQWAVEDGTGVWKSTDAGITWAPSNAGLEEAESGARIELGTSPLEPGLIYALVENADGVDPVYQSDDGGELWMPYLAAPGTTLSDIAGSQGWYDLMVHPHPKDKDRVFLGGIDLYRAQRTAGTTQAGFLQNAEEINTESFLSFVNFSAAHLRGGLRVGTQEDESTIQPEDMVSVEVRFGPGRSQMAHRFVPRDTSGVNFADYPYRDYVSVPFEVWDVDNDRQLGVSFRDREDNGAFDLSLFNSDNLDREYVLISARDYTGSVPDAALAQNGGVRTDLAYFFWPILATGATWNPEELPESLLRFTWRQRQALQGNLTSIGSGVHVDQHVMRSVSTGPLASDVRLVLGNDGGVFVSNDAGQNWVGRFRGYNTTQFYGVDKKPGRTIYLGGTQDNGSWRSLGNPGPTSAWFGAGGGDGFDVLWHKQDDQRMITTSQYSHFRRSLNGGQSFQDAIIGLADTGSDCGCAQFLTSLSARADNSDVIYTLGSKGVWRSSNFAGSWQLRPIPAAEWGYGGSGRVHVSNADGEVVWAGYEMDPTASGSDHAGALQRSTNDGETFSSTTSPSWAPGRLAGLNSSHEDANTVYATFGFFGDPKLIRSRDGGETWEDLSGFLGWTGTGVVSPNGFPDVTTYDVLDFPGSPVLWAATEIGLIESLDDGATWQLADNGLPAVAIWQIRLLDDEVVLATHGRGVWTLPVGSVPTETEEEPTLPLRLEIGSAWPNPFSQSLTITWTAPVSTTARVEVFDVQGRRVATLFDGAVPAGRQEVGWEAGALVPGAYWIRVGTPEGTVTRSVVHIR
ncbi:MAG: T9SS type A sorting domain-containing protein [Bacteroidetes bacterium]|nr:T9SS type A sorting domain-containing protein [Bacteroidota bacterium]